jgi:TPR repeat protein
LLIADGLGITYAELRVLLSPINDVSLIEEPPELAKWAERGNAGALLKLTNIAHGGNAEALTALGILYLVGRGVAKNVPRGESLLKQGAALGSSVAMRELGVLCEKGTRGERDPVAAVGWYTKAAELEDAKAQFYLAWMYLEGSGVSIPNPEDRVKRAAPLILASARQGYRNALNKLGWMHKTGTGVPQSLEKAAECFRLSANKGNDRACGNFAMMCINGEGIRKDYVLAAQYFLMGAEQGNPDCQYHLSKLLERGEGIRRNDRASVRWLRAAALQSHTDAERELGERYAKGRGVVLDLVVAYVWLIRAERDGDQSTRQTINAIERQMVPTQRERARSLPPAPEDRSRSALLQDGDDDLIWTESTA